uniref:MYND-type domain-containing protein n=1 Tax=Chromera velia CCMP2878 TaxID=1169474 RepID=A0A0G4HEW5_9ALVE|eukprot:Cvel_26717.t1-p1 / transcript=Cvel_26717.t1 / gene=Cvel_26717 / organism=Chromera_velia_CCMP2878 / gene_product=hypothetical protein / transcript_product=hypothetical protein / location=Cvel_scaffold3222:2140-3747(+) / protein_length=536 / sequence_SO=supercontig / SO=protein_coding / is_pseudo=false
MRLRYEEREKRIREDVTSLLTLLVTFSPRLQRLLWKSGPFLYALKSLIRLTAETLRDPESDRHLERALFLFLRKMCWVTRENVVALNGAQQPGGEGTGREGEALDFSRFFRALYWESARCVKLRKQEQHGAACRVVRWGEWMSVFESYGMSAEVRKAHREAFASAEAATDARSLYDDALSRCDCPLAEASGGVCVCLRPSLGEQPRLMFLYRVKAIEVTVQNRKVGRKKERVKNLKSLKQIDSEWEMAIQKDTAEATEGEKRSEEFLKAEREARLFLALLILSLEKSTGSQSESERSRPQQFLLEWFKKEQKKKKEGQEKGVHHYSSPTEISLPSLSAFLEGHVLSEWEEEEGIATRSSDSRPESRKTSEEKEKPQTYRPLRSRDAIKEILPEFCTNCGRESPKMKICAGCEMVSYCSQECQRAHWKGKGNAAEGRAPPNAHTDQKRAGVTCPFLQFLRDDASPSSDCAPTDDHSCPPLPIHKKRCALLSERVSALLLSQTSPLSDLWDLFAQLPQQSDASVSARPSQEQGVACLQ